MNIKNTEIGVAGEFLVLSDLWQRGLPASKATESLHYDILITPRGGSPIAVQVKSTSGLRVFPIKSHGKIYTYEKYRFSGTRKKMGSHVPLNYDAEIKLLAFVAMDILKVLYRPNLSDKRFFIFDKEEFENTEHSLTDSLNELDKLTNGKKE